MERSFSAILIAFYPTLVSVMCLGFSVDSSESAYNGIYLDGCLNRSTAYTDLHPDGDYSRSFLKDGDSLMLIPRSQPIMGYILMATRANPRPIRVFTLTMTLQGVS